MYNNNIINDSIISRVDINAIHRTTNIRAQKLSNITSTPNGISRPIYLLPIFITNIRNAPNTLLEFKDENNSNNITINLDYILAIPFF